MTYDKGAVRAVGKGTWDKEVGPLGGQRHAEIVAKDFVRENPQLKWTGAWTTTREGEMSVIRVQLIPLEGGIKSHKEVKSIDEIKPGDQCFVKRTLYEHHFIVTKIEKNGKKGTVHVIEYAGTDGGSSASSSGILSGGPKAKVKAGTYKFPEQKMYKVEYTICHDMEATVKAAKDQLDLADYDLLFGNCEHFSTACKNGTWTSEQVAALGIAQ